MALLRMNHVLNSWLGRTTTFLLTEPAVTGGLLYALTRGPEHIRERILQPFRNNILAKNPASRLAILITTLKVLTALGVTGRINKVLNRFALNGWALRRRGAPFEFGPARKEVVVITGGSSGFGYEMVKGFSKYAKVVVFDVNDLPPELEKLPGVHFYRVDVSDFKQVEQVCAEVKLTHGDPSVLVNNAGIASGGGVLDISNERTEKVFKINIVAHFVLIREFLPGMLRMHKGHIVTIASMASFFASPGLLDYSCTKIAALYLNDGIRAECLKSYPGGEGICTTSVHPSWYATNIIRGAEEALAKHGIIPRPPVEVSDRVVEQVLKARSGKIVLPPGAEMWTGLRWYPLWVQDFIGGVGMRDRERLGVLD